MAEQQGCARRNDEHGQGAETEGRGAKGQRRRQHPAIPQRMDRIPDDVTRHRAAAGRLNQAVYRAGIMLMHRTVPRRYLSNNLNIEMSGWQVVSKSLK
ncbi:hypothetical protein D3C80_1907740 [compost metagenome]